MYFFLHRNPFQFFASVLPSIVLMIRNGLAHVFPLTKFSFFLRVARWKFAALICKDLLFQIENLRSELPNDSGRFLNTHLCHWLLILRFGELMFRNN